MNKIGKALINIIANKLGLSIKDTIQLIKELNKEIEND